jgi:hypothetical protein
MSQRDEIIDIHRILKLCKISKRSCHHDSDVDPYAIIGVIRVYLQHAMETKLTIIRDLSEHKGILPVRVRTQGVTYPQMWFRQR